MIGQISIPWLWRQLIKSGCPANSFSGTPSYSHPVNTATSCSWPLYFGLDENTSVISYLKNARFLRPVRDRINGVALYLTARTRYAPLFSFSVAVRQKGWPCLFVCFYSDYGKQDGRVAIIKINSSCRKTTRDMTTLERKWWDSTTLYFIFQKCLQNVCIEHESNLLIHEEFISFKMAAIWVSFCLPNNLALVALLKGKKNIILIELYFGM